MFTRSSRKYDKAFVAADAGLATLPTAVVAARQAIARLAEVTPPAAPPHPDDVQASEAGRLAEAARSGAVDIDPAPIVDALAELERDRHRAALLDAARAVADHHLAATVVDGAGIIIADHLAVAQAKVVDDIAGAVRAFTKYGSNERDLLAAPKASRDAWLRLAGLVGDYRVVRGSRAALLDPTAELYDTTGLFAEIRNTEVVWPDITATTVSPSRWRPADAPWHHDDPQQRIVAMLKAGCELWCPTPAEQDARWFEVFGERVAAQQRNRAHAAGYRALAG